DQGNWSFTPSKPLVNGPHDLTTRVTDPAGNTGDEGQHLIFKVDIDPGQVQLTDVLDDVGGITSSVSQNGVTDDTRPTLTGTAKAGSIVTIFVDDKPQGSVKVEAGGEWSFTPNSDLGQGSHTFSASAEDLTGHVSTSGTWVFSVDSVAPTAPFIDSAADDVGSKQPTAMTSGSETDDPSPTLTGRAEANSIVKIYDQRGEIGSVQALANGQWSYTPTTGLSEGPHDFYVTSTDKAGNVSAPSSTFTLTLDFTAPDGSKVTITGVDDQVGSITGKVDPGQTTDDNRPTISGTGAEKGNTITVYRGTEIIGTAIVQENLSWSMTPTKQLEDGVAELTAKESDAVGNTTVASPNYSISIKTGVPLAPVITSVEDNVGPVTKPLQKGVVTDDNTPTLNGTAEAGGIVKVYDDGKVIGSTKVGTDGKWSFTPSALGEGNHNLTATVTDAIGATSVHTGIYDIVVDTKAPEPATDLLVTDDMGSKTGPISAGDTTDDNTPTLSGKAEPNSVVHIYDNGEEIGTALVTDQGNWSFTPSKPLVNGPHDLTTRVTDPAGNTGDEGQHLIFKVDIDPGQVQLTDVLDDVGGITSSVSQNGVTDDTRPTLTGTAKAGSIVTIFVDDKPQGSVKVEAGGEWSFTPNSDLGQGSHTFSASAEDLTGHVSTSGTWVFSVDSVAPTAPFIDSAADDVGSKQPTAMTSGSETDDPSPTLTGRAEANSIVKIYDQRGEIGSVQALANGQWSYTPTTGLSEGPHDFYVTSTDKAGNVSAPSSTFTLTLDFTPPDVSKVAITEVVDQYGLVTGPVSKGSVLDDRNPLVNGTGAEKGNTITVYTTDGDGNTKVLGTTTVGSNGQWTLTATGSLYDGKNTLTVEETDKVGNSAKPSTSYDVIMSLTPGAPVIDSIIDDTGTTRMELTNNSLTKDNTPTLSGTSSVAEGDTITIYNGNAKVGTTTAGPGGSWSFTPNPALVDGTYNFKVTGTNNVGQESAPSGTETITIDATISDAAISITSISDDLGISNTDFNTSDTTLLINGTLNKALLADEWVEVSVDGGKTWTKASSTTASSWTVDLQSKPLTSADYTIQARVVDQAGNIGDTDAHALTVSTVAPNLNGMTTSAIITTDTSSGLKTGDLFSHSATEINTDMITRDRTVTIKGALSAALQSNQYLQISFDNGSNWTTLLSETGTDWNYKLAEVTQSTTFNYQLRVIDAAGNLGTNVNFKSNYQVVIDLEAPNAILGAPDVPQIVNSTTTYTFNQTKYGNVEAGSIVSLVSDVNGNGTYQEGLDQIIGFAKANDDGSWSISSTMPAGAHNLAFMVWDAAGNRSSLSASTSIGVTEGDGKTLIEQKWGGTTDGDGSGLNAAAVTIGTNGLWSFFQSARGTSGSSRANSGRVYNMQNLEDYSSKYLAQPSDVTFDNYGHFVNSATFADINRDGLTDVMSQVSAYDNGGRTAYWMQNADGSYTAKSVNQGSLNHLGGVIAYDRHGDGYLDFVLADSAPDSTSFLKNENGVLSPDGTYGRPGGAIPSNLSLMHEIGAVDIDNNGTVDITAHVDVLDYYGTNYFDRDDGNSLAIIYNQTTGGSKTTFGKLDYYGSVFRTDGGTDYGNLSISMTYADYNGDGWLDLFLSRGQKGSANTNESRIYLNDGTGKLNATDAKALWFGDSLDGGTSLAVDWNHDGKMDIIEVPRSGVTGSPVLYLNQGNNIWGKTPVNLTATTYNNLTGAVALDYDWDGSMDLVLYRAGADATVVSSDHAAPTLLVKNTNIAPDGTSLQIRIVDGQGINTFYSNTVKLYNSKGELVATQLINPQSSGSSNSMGLVSFFGLDPNEVYSVQLLRITNGQTDHVGAVGSQGGYTNATVNENWGGLTTGKSHDAYVLTAESDTAATNTTATGIVGTGYNDTFFASAGDDTYNGSGGWNQIVSGKAVWSATAGMDIVDYSRSASAITAVLWEGTGKNGSATGQGSDKLISIEGLIGSSQADTFTDSSANNLFEGRSGNDTFYLINGGNDTLMYKVLSGMETDGTGGNGSDIVHGFHVGDVVTDSDADLIDLSDLLDYNGSISFFQDDGKMELDYSSQGILKYLKVENVGNDTVISIDRDGSGNANAYTNVITLTNVQTDLETLLQNNQIIV
ncbi:Ig-like domain repeat protein, partial [Serratia sp. DD3]|uniref:Ig-like domain repeat protein n=1 Tax=Serratia sp. DD3 TaxID=1410619 RepID=UPI00055ED642